MFSSAELRARLKRSRRERGKSFELSTRRERRLGGREVGKGRSDIYSGKPVFFSRGKPPDFSPRTYYVFVENRGRWPSFAGTKSGGRAIDDRYRAKG